MKKYTLILLCLIASFICRAANNTTNYIPIMTPESATLGQYGAYPVSLYTGGVDISIPLHTIKTNGITIPISLQYTGTGLIPNKDCGKIGHDWALYAGGAITRTVNGVPDEWERHDAISDSDPDFELNGLLTYIRSANEQLKNGDIRRLHHLNLIESGWETTPDMFSFNFCGHNGQFMIDHDGSVRVVGNNSYKVDISGLKPQRLTEPTQPSLIIITDGEGTRYTFGGNIYSLEVNLKQVPGNVETIPNGVIVAFYLTRIETVDGRFVEFHYTDKEDDQNGTYANFDPHTKGHSDGSNIIRAPHYTDYYKSIATNNSSTIVFNPAGELAVSYTKTAYLHKIITSFGEDVVFTYEDKLIPFFTRAQGELWEKGNIPNSRLKDIRITNSNNEVIKYVSLHHSYSISYDYRNQSHTDGYQKIARMFLDSLFVNQERYAIEYNERERLPLPYTRGIDLQGYYNGKDHISNLLGISSTTQTVDFTNRQPNTGKASMGMISKIIYPTGGSSAFTFEGHNYSQAVGFANGGSNIVSLSASQSYGTVGGLRIKQISNTPGSTVSYSYTLANGSTSGVFNDTKRFNLNIYTDGNGWKPARLIINSGSNIVAGNTVSEPEVGYSRVVETIGEGNGYKVYTYSTFADYPDEPILEGNDSTIVYSSSATVEDICSTIHLTSLHLERGKLQSVEEYNSSNALVRENIYEYTPLSQHRRDAIYSNGYRLLFLGKYLANSVAHYYYPKHITAVTTREYAGSQVLSRRSDYLYNQHNQQVSVEQTLNSDGMVLARKIYYPKDFPSDPLLVAMADSNMVNAVVKEESYVSSILEHTKEYQYALYYDKYYDICAINETYKNSPPFNSVIIHSRDRHRNIESLTEFGKPAVHYLWSYGYQYPVARLENITTAEFLATMPLSVRDAIGSEFILENVQTTLNRLNSSQYFPNAHITLFRYKPQVGMSYSRQPYGMETFYTYCNYNKLANIAEGDENDIMTSYQYNVMHKDNFSACWQNSFTQTFAGTQTLVCKAEGGSGDYRYQLSLSRNGSTVSTSSTGRINCNLTTAGDYVFSGTVTDNITGAEAHFSNTFTVVIPEFLEFSQSDENTVIDHGCYRSTATIVCTKETQISFIFNYTVESGNYRCSIGEYANYSGETDFGEQSFTITLPEGEHEVELILENIIGNATLELLIEDVHGEHLYLGEDLQLNLSTNKIN